MKDAPRGHSLTIDLDALDDQVRRTPDAFIQETRDLVVDEDAGDTDRLPERAITNENGSVTLPLLYPVPLRIKKDNKERTETHDSLTFHRLTGADQRVISGASDADQAMVAFACSTRLSRAVMTALFDRMDLADVADGGRVINSFLTSGRPTGRSS